MTETINQSEHDIQLEESNDALKNGQVDYIKSLEQTIELMTQNLDIGISGYWIDRRVDKDDKKPVIRSDLWIFNVCVAYVILKDGKWSVFFLRREETKKFSGYRFCRLEGYKSKPYYHCKNDKWVKDGNGIEEAKWLALRSVR